MEQQAARLQPALCPECGGVVVRATVASKMDGNVMLTVLHPGHLFGTASDLTALVCTDCGYTRLYAKEPYKLRPKDKDAAR